jgi:methyl-accepting chemotaxis protein
MPPQNERRPFRNFFIKRSIQLKIVAKILITILLTAVLTTAALGAVYSIKAQKGSYYFMSDDVRQDIELINILGMILPSVIAAESVSLILGLGIGLFSSRKVAVPIYKFEKWVSQLKTGHLNTHIAFREEAGLKDLAIQCNAMADVYRFSLREVRDAAISLENEIAENPGATELIRKIQQVLGRFEL